MARCAPLGLIPGLAHAFGTRCVDGSATFDAGRTDDESHAVASRRARFVRAAGLGRAAPVVLRQVHGDRVVSVAAAGPGERGDGLIWSGETAAAACVLTADCVPILLAAADGSLAAAVHAGWRGAAAGIVARAVRELAALGCPPSALVVALGPAIGSCCYEVGPEVVAALCGSVTAPVAVTAEAGPTGRARVDLHAVIAAQLEAAGVARGAIHGAPWCTRCRGDLFFSYRRDGERAGRQITAVGAVARP